MLLARPRLALLGAALLAVALAGVANVFLTYDTAVDTIVDPGSQAFRDEAQFEDAFGADPLLVLIHGDVKSILGGNGLGPLVNAEGVLSSPANQARGVKTPYGPATISQVAAIATLGSAFAKLQQVELDAQQKALADAKAAGKSDTEASDAGRQAAIAAGQAYLKDALAQFPELAQVGTPGPTNPRWVSAIFLDKDGVPKPRFANVIPDASNLLVTARLRTDVSSAGINGIVASERGALRSQPIPGAQVHITGVPVLQVAVERALRVSLVVGMLTGFVAMAVMLLGAMRRLGALARLLPLGAGFLSVAMLAGILALLGQASLRMHDLFNQGVPASIVATIPASLNPATLAAFPIALGLAVDYGVQFLFRYQQAAGLSAEAALGQARAAAGRATGRAARCTMAGLLALLASSVPMVRQFGVVMVLATGTSWLISRLVVLGVLRAWPGLARSGPAPSPRPAEEEEVSLFGFEPEQSAAMAEAARAVPLESPRGRGPAGGLMDLARARGRAILAVALVIAGVGWIAIPFASFETDPERLVSPNLPAFADVRAVRDATGYSGELDFVLSGPDVTSKEALQWATDLQATALRDSAGKLKPLGSLADLFNTISAGKDLTPERIKALLGVIPGYFTDALVDRQHHIARVAFGIPLGPVADQEAIIGRILADVEPPPGYQYHAAGLTYVGVSGLQAIRGGQVLLNALGAVLVLAVLLATYRRRRAALVAWVPTLLVAGWSSAVLTVLRVPLTPMTAVLGAVVVAFGTEFAVLWLERCRESVAAGATLEDAVAGATLGAAPGILVSGTALALGFLALAVGGLPGISSLGFDLPMVRDFGLVAAMDILLAVAAALVVLPALVLRAPGRGSL